MRGPEEALFRSARRLSCRPRLALAVIAAVALSPPATAYAASGPEPGAYQKHDFRGFKNILPPGQGANANALQIASFLATGAPPPHASDRQLDMYSNLVYATPGLARGHISDYYKDASFGVPKGSESRVYSPRGDVTIVRDRAFGVPHIYGATRPGAMFGAGFAGAEDRLFMMDVLRHAARAQLSAFAGGSAGNRAMDQSIWADTPYNESEFRQQYDRADDLYGRQGELIQRDVQNYVAGINAYIAEARTNPLKLPGEYAVIGQPLNDFTVNDVIATASLVAGIFGKGGGGELNSALALEAARKRFGASGGKQVWADFREANDPERPVTVRRGRFPYQGLHSKVRGRALPDPGSVQFEDVVKSSTAGSSTSASQSKLPDIDDVLAPLRQLGGASSAVLVAGRETTSGHPIAVMGPQVSYFSPEILMEQDVHAPATDEGPPIDARGTAFPGTNLYVQLGRGRDYAWSATSAGQDIIDTFAVRLCDPSGGRATIDSNYYRFEGRCLPFEVLTRTNSWLFESPGEAPSPGSETLRALRSKLGIVIARATIDGKPYAYTKLRDTYFHEVDPSALGFADYNNPRKMESPEEFMHAACEIAFTFNWFYIDDEHIAYFNSGQNPVRAPHVDPNFPTLGKKRFLWRGFDPDSATEEQTPCRAHPHVVDQRFLTSWNNAQARGYHAADDNFAFGSVFRSQPLNARIRGRIAGSKRISLEELIDLVEAAGTVDLRGAKVLRWVLKVIATGPVRDPEERAAIRTLRSWKAQGAHRMDLDKDGHYDQSRAVRIMDAWWPRLVEAEFRPTLGQDAFGAFRTMLGLDDPPGDVGSAYISGWYGYVEKDLRTILGDEIRGRYSRVYCGNGDLGECRSALLGSLREALRNDGDAELYPEGPCTLGPAGMSADAQECHDSVHFTAVGAISQPDIPWINRPTFQQAVEVRGHR